MRLAALTVAALLCAGQAWATVHNVTNDATLTTAMAAGGAQPGDVVNIAAGSYTGSFVPANSGTAGSPIRIVGSQSNPASVSTTSGLAWAEGTDSRSYISWTGIKVNDDVSWYRAVGCSLSYALVDSGGLRIFGKNSDLNDFFESRGNYIGDCTFRQNLDADYVVRFNHAYQTTVVRCRFFTTTTGATFERGRGRYLFRSSGNTFTDCLLSVEAWGETNGEQQAHGLRDSSLFNTFTRDTMLLGMTSKGARRALLSQSGSFPGTTGYNNWIDCYYRSFAPNDGATEAGFEFQDGTNGGLLQGCQFISRLGIPLSFSGSALADSIVIRHCTFYTGVTEAFNYMPASNPTNSRFNGCALIARQAASTCLSNGRTLFRMNTRGAFASSDSNTFYCSDTTRTFRSTGATDCYTPAGWRTATSNDLASRSYVLAAGVVTDTTWATLDLRPAASSTLVSALFPDGYAGAFDAEDEPDPPAPSTGSDADDWFYIRREER